MPGEPKPDAKVADERVKLLIQYAKRMKATSSTRKMLASLMDAGSSAALEGDDFP